MIKTLHNALFADDDILFSEGDSYNVTFCNDEMGILSADLNNSNLDNANCDGNDPETIIYVRLMTWYNRLSYVFKKDMSKELMALALHSTR